MTHDARSLFALGKIDEVLEGEEEQIICCHHKHIIVDMELIHSIEQVAHCTQTSVVGRGAIIDNGDGFGVMLLLCPILEDGSKLMVGYYHMLVNIRYRIYIIKHTTQNG